MIYGPDPYRVVLPTSIMRHSQNWTPDFSKILKRGVKSIREEAQSKLTALSEPRDAVYKKPFPEAVVITCNATTAWSRRYAQCARDLAANEKNPQRKKELQEIAEVCDWVPENPARTFREALQAQWWGRCSTAWSRRAAPWARAALTSTCGLTTRKTRPRGGSRRSPPLDCSSSYG